MQQPVSETQEKKKKKHKNVLKWQHTVFIIIRFQKYHCDDDQHTTMLVLMDAD